MCKAKEIFPTGHDCDEDPAVICVMDLADYLRERGSDPTGATLIRYMDMVDFSCELGMAIYGNAVYATTGLRDRESVHR